MNNRVLRIIIFTSILSITLLVFFGFLKVYQPHILELESRWLIIAALPLFVGVIYTGIIRKFKALGFEYESAIILEANPSRKNLAEGTSGKLELAHKEEPNVLPADYIYINQTSFLRESKQEEFQAITHVNDVPHYDIRVIINSYYKGALERIKFVKYYLHQSYPQPIQIRSNIKDHFLLKEIANGEYVLIAEVFLNDLEKPIILSRYITLWTSGPNIT